MRDDIAILALGKTPESRNRLSLAIRDRFVGGEDEGGQDQGAYNRRAGGEGSEPTSHQYSPYAFLFVSVWTHDRLVLAFLQVVCL
ncbi:MAG: hypothetical protein AB7P23_11310, partial [Amphiplicatus sp.]